MTAGALRVIGGGGATPRGWEALWAKDEWHQRELPHGDLAVTYDREVVLRFGGLAQPWLKEAAKRWARARLLGSLSPRSMERYLRELMEFSRWLADRDVASPGSITRELLEEDAVDVENLVAAGGLLARVLKLVPERRADDREQCLPEVVIPGVEVLEDGDGWRCQKASDSASAFCSAVRKRSSVISRSGL